jgi:EmrB/QacA subfamily drug resistance transporter
VTGPGPPGRTTLMRVTLLAGPVLSMVDSSVVNVAVPVIVRDLHTTLGAASWTVSGYLLGLAGGLAATPWLARRFGTMRSYTAVLLGFTLSSAACALAPDVGLLITMRVVQGLVGAPMVPLALGLLFGEDGEAGNIPVSAGIVFFAAPALGPAIGGLLISGFGWRSVFLINLPIGFAALAAAFFTRASRPASASDPAARPDLAGFTLLGAGLSLATYGASQGPASGWLSARSAPAWFGGLVLMAGYAAWSHWRSAGTGPAPAVSFELLRSARWSATLLLTCVASVVLFAMLFLAPVFLQQVQRHSATVTGLALLPQGVIMGFASALGNVIVGAQVRAAMVYSIVAAGLALLGVSTLGLLLLTAASPVWLTAVLLCGRGVALGITVQLLVRGLLGGLSAAQSPDANTLFNMSERLSGSFGIALLATFYASRARASGSPVTALHDCAIALTAACAAGALGALALAAAETRVTRSAGRRRPASGGA